MLALTRKSNEAIIINGNIEVKILDIQGDKVKIGINAPKEVSIYRKEIYEIVKSNNQEAIRNKNMALDELNRIINEIEK